MRRTILLADDSPTIQRLVAQTFADGDFDVVSVGNGELAIQRLADIRPDLVLADVYMPGKNGYEVCAFVRAHPELGATPVVLLIGAFDAFDEETALQVGASASITKPFEAQVLVDLVVSVLERNACTGSTEEAPVSADLRVRIDPGVAFVAAEPPAVPRNEASREDIDETEPPQPEESDLLGLEALFKEDHLPRPVVELSEADIERIADRVMRKLSVQAIEGVAWDIVPDIVEKILRDSPKHV